LAYNFLGQLIFFLDLVVKFSQKEVNLKIIFVWDVRRIICQNRTDVLEGRSASIFTVSSRTRNLTQVLLMDLSCYNLTTILLATKGHVITERD